MQRRLVLLFFSCLIASAGCGYDSNGPYDSGDTTNVVGSYQATLITRTTDTATSDLSAGGLTFEMNLAKDGSMTGTYLITTGNERPGNPFAIRGRWNLAGAILTVTDDQNTFVSHVPFTRRQDRLEGSGVVAQATIRMVLERRLT